MFTLPRLPVERQRNVGTALEEHFKTGPTYPPAILSGAQAVIAATADLARSTQPSLFTIDGATDTVISAVYRILDDFQRGYAATIVALDAAQRAQLEAAELLEGAWFPEGIGFIHDSPGFQNDAMRAVRTSLADPEKGAAIQAAVDLLGLGPLVQRLLAHMALYAKKLGLAGEVVTAAPGEPRDPTDVWHDVYTAFAIDVNAAFRDDPATRMTLVGAYESQLGEHRADMAKLRKRVRAEAKAKAEAEAKAGEKKNGGG